MYYKSLLETLKDEGENRIRIDAEFSSINEYRVEMTLIPKDINICPSCGSTNVIKNWQKRCYATTSFCKVQHNIFFNFFKL